MEPQEPQSEHQTSDVSSPDTAAQGGTLSSQPESTKVVAPAAPLPWKEKISLGFADFGVGFMFDLGQSYLSKFYTDIVMLAPAQAAAIFSIAKIYDAFMDPIAGGIINGRKKIGPRGKLRPWFIPSAVVLALLTIVTFSVPDIPLESRFLFCLIAYMAWGMCYAFLVNPLTAMSSLMTRDGVERSQLSTSRQIGSHAAVWITGMIFIPLVMYFGGGQMTAHGYQITTILMVIIGIASICVVYKNCHEHVKVPRAAQAKKREGLKTYFKVVFTNRPLIAIILMGLCTISATNANNTMMVYFCQYNLGNIALQPLVNGIMVGFSIVGLFAMPVLVKHFGKKPVVIVCLFIGAAANLLNFLIPTNVPTFIVLVTIGYTALAIPNGILWTFVADAIDFGEWHTGVRMEATTSATVNFSRKLAQALAAIISMGLLAITGYVANQAQSPATLLGIKSAMTLYPAIALVVAAVCILVVYNLDDAKFNRISNELAQGRWEKGSFEE